MSFILSSILWRYSETISGERSSTLAVASIIKARCSLRSLSSFSPSAIRIASNPQSASESALSTVSLIKFSSSGALSKAKISGIRRKVSAVALLVI